MWLASSTSRGAMSGFLMINAQRIFRCRASLLYLSARSVYDVRSSADMMTITDFDVILSAGYCATDSKHKAPSFWHDCSKLDFINVGMTIRHRLDFLPHIGIISNGRNQYYFMSPTSLASIFMSFIDANTMRRYFNSRHAASRAPCACFIRVSMMPISPWNRALPAISIMKLPRRRLARSIRIGLTMIPPTIDQLYDGAWLEIRRHFNPVQIMSSKIAGHR